MGVLEQMRSGSDSTFMQVVFALIIVAFVGLYVRPQGDRSGVVASVDGVKIMDTDYSRVYRNELRRIEVQSGRTLSDAEQRQVGEQVRQKMIEDQVLLQEAHRLGLEVSDSEVARQLLGLTFLRGADGKFSADQYAKFLKRQQFTKADFEETLREDLLRGKLQQLVYMGASISEPAMRQTFVETETRVDLQVVRIRPTSFEDRVVPTAEERAAWLVENEAMVKETYDRDFERLYNHPEQVRGRLIRLGVVPGGPPLADLVPRLNKLRAEAEGGADFASLAKRWSEDPSAAQGGDLGLRAVATLSTEMSQALEGVQPGSMTRVFTTETDARLVLVEERVPPKVDPIEEVRDSIADRLIRAEKVPVMAATFAEEQLLAKWKESGELPQDLLDEYGQSARDTGPIPTQKAGNPFAPPQGLLDDARTAEVGTVLPEVYEEGGVLYVAKLTARIDPDMTLFETEKDTIRESILAGRRDAFYQAWVADLKSRATIE